MHRLLGCCLALLFAVGGWAPVLAQSAADTSSSASASAIETERTAGGTRFQTPVHALAWEDGREGGVQAQAVVNEERGYTAFALRLRVDADAVGGDAAPTLVLEADGQQRSVRGRNVSVRDTTVVVVVQRGRFADLARATTARLAMDGRTAVLPAELQRQMRALAETCTRQPLGCAPDAR